LLLVVSTSAIDCLERLVSEMTFYVSTGTLNPTHSLTQSSHAKDAKRSIVNQSLLPSFISNCRLLTVYKVSHKQSSNIISSFLID